MRHAVAAFGALLLQGCFLVHGTSEPSSDASGDAAVPDGDAAAICPFVAGYRVCGERCPVPCPDEWYCSRVDVCLPWWPMEPQGGDTCALQLPAGGSWDDAVYCWSDRICAISHFPTDSAPTMTGVCMPPEFCAEAPDAGLDFPCQYSDGTSFLDGPPEPPPSCPFADDVAPFCGVGCAEACPWVVPWGVNEVNYAVSCIGISETRSLGVCALFTRDFCTPENSERLVGGCEREDSFGEPCSCLVLRRADGWPAFGWVTLTRSCEAYRAQYPDDVRCNAPGWSPDAG